MEKYCGHPSLSAGQSLKGSGGNVSEIIEASPAELRALYTSMRCCLALNASLLETKACCHERNLRQSPCVSDVAEGVNFSRRGCSRILGSSPKIRQLGNKD